MPDLHFDLCQAPLPEAVRFIFSRLEAAGHSCYVVGGAVRDRLLGRSPDDFDLASSARPAEMLRIFSDCKRLTDGLRHGTLGLIFKGKVYEVTSFRADGEYRDHRRPEKVRFSRNLADDIFRRDFTINALAFRPEDGLLDLVGGTEDLKNGLIRCVGNPERRFAEDALRILRAYRFAAVLGFRLEEETRRAALHHLEDLRYISGERIRAELLRLLKGACFAGTWPLQREMLRRILPLDPRLPEEGIKKELSALPDDFALRLAFLLRPLPEDSQNRLADTLRLSRKEKRAFCRFNRILDERPDTTITGLMRFARENGTSLTQWAELGSLKSDAAASGDQLYWQVVFAQIEDIRGKKLPRHPGELKIDGEDLIRLGYRSSRRLGRVLDRLWEDVISGAVPNKLPDLLERAFDLMDEL